MDHHGKDVGSDPFLPLKFAGAIGRSLDSVPRSARRSSWTYENVTEQAPSFSLRFLHKPSRLSEMLEKASDTTRENSDWNAKVGKEEHEKVMRELKGREGSHLNLGEKIRRRIDRRFGLSNSDVETEAASSIEDLSKTRLDEKGSDTMDQTADDVNTADDTTDDNTTVNTTDVNTTDVNTTDVNTTDVNTTDVNTTDVNTTAHNIASSKGPDTTSASPGYFPVFEKSPTFCDQSNRNSDSEKNIRVQNEEGGEGNNEGRKKATSSHILLALTNLAGQMDGENVKSDEAASKVAGSDVLIVDTRDASGNSGTSVGFSPALAHDDPLSPSKNHFPSDEPQPYKLVRKKSGEVLKSSLKVSGWGKSQSLPSTPTYKQVHFGCLNDVRYFKEKDKPAAILALNTPNASDEDYDDDDFDDYDDEVDGKDTFTLQPYQQDDWLLKTLNFPALSYPAKINANTPVFLERLFISMDKRFVIGHIAVQNIAYEKYICVRYSPDPLWLTIVEIPTTYVPDGPSILREHNYDRFLFQIPLEAVFASSDCNEADEKEGFTVRKRQYQFCVKYNAGSKEFWDNNSHHNYAVELCKTTKVQNHVTPDKQIRTHTARPKYSSLYMKRRVSDSNIPKQYQPELTPPTLASLALSNFDMLNFYINDDHAGLGEVGDFVKNNYYLSLPLLAGLYGPNSLNQKSAKLEPTQRFSNVTAPEQRKFELTGLESVLHLQLYKELLDNYCFFLTEKKDEGGPYAVSSFLVE